MTENTRLFPTLGYQAYNLRDPKTGRLLPKPPEAYRFWPSMSGCEWGHDKSTACINFPTRDGSPRQAVCAWCCFSWQAVIAETAEAERHRIGP